jgi:hypothetical protein
MKELSTNRQFSGRFHDIFIIFRNPLSHTKTGSFKHFWEPASTRVNIYLLITGGYMSILIRTAKHGLTYRGQLMSHDLQNTWSVIIHRSLTKSKYRFWVVDWFEFPIWHILAYCMYEWNDQFCNFEHDFPFWESRTLCDHKMQIFAFTKQNLLLKMGFKVDHQIDYLSTLLANLWSILLMERYLCLNEVFGLALLK